MGISLGFIVRDLFNWDGDLLLRISIGDWDGVYGLVLSVGIGMIVCVVIWGVCINIISSPLTHPNLPLYPPTLKTQPYHPLNPQDNSRM